MYHFTFKGCVGDLAQARFLLTLSCTRNFSPDLCIHSIFSPCNMNFFGKLNVREFFFCSGRVHEFFGISMLTGYFLKSPTSSQKCQMLRPFPRGAKKRSDESARPPPMRPGSIPVRCHMWVEFVVGCPLAPRVFLRFSTL